RCQRYDFRRISTETIKDRLANIMKSEGIEVEEKGLMYIAKVADGSMRDALSLLDECTAFYMDQALTYDKILSVLGAVDTEIFYRLFEAIRKEDVLSAVDIVNDIVMEGRDIRQFVLDFTWYIRNMLLVKNMDSMEDILDMSTDTLNILKEEAKDMPEEVLMRFIRVLSDLSNSLRDATQKRVLLEITVIKLCKPAMEQDYESLIQRMTSMEQRMESGAFTVAAVQSPAESLEKKTAPIDPGLKKPLPEATPEAVKEAAREFKAIIQDAPGMTKKFLETAMVTVSDEGELMLVFDLIDNIQHMAYKMFQDPEKIAELEELISEHIEQQVKVVVQGNETVTPKENLYTDAITAFAGKNGVVIETEDF
ncbi:MAG: DNA polymerase III subunit gamma/tau, partial [Lachnospiraceae bacterium]|nr:DNA polymerase III subunit gamma/tau [Lachnospiraceae bacterium]